MFSRTWGLPLGLLSYIKDRKKVSGNGNEKGQRRGFWGGGKGIICQALLLSGSWEKVQPFHPELRGEDPSESSRCVSWGWDLQAGAELTLDKVEIGTGQSLTPTRWECEKQENWLLWRQNQKGAAALGPTSVPSKGYMHAPWNEPVWGLSWGLSNRATWRNLDMHFSMSRGWGRSHKWPSEQKNKKNILQGQGNCRGKKNSEKTLKSPGKWHLKGKRHLLDPSEMKQEDWLK